MIETITANDNVQFYWLIVKADFDDDDDEEIKSVSLAVITKLFLRIFIWVEKFKTAKKASKNQKVSEENCALKTNE